MKISILQREFRLDLKRIVDALLIIYLVIVTFYGTLFIPFHPEFLDRYPLLFPLSIIVIFKAALFFSDLNSSKKSAISFPKRTKKQVTKAKDTFEQSTFRAFPKKHYITAFLILITVFCFKSYISRGITSHVFHSDEDIIINDFIRMMSEKTLDYERYNYPPLFYYSNYALFSIYYNLELKDRYGNVGDLPHYPLYEFGRQINAAYGALFVTAVFILSYQIFGFLYSLLASFAVFLSPLRLNIDSLFRPHPAADFYLIVAFIILISLLREPKTYKFILLGVLTSFALCSFFLRVVIVIPVGFYLIKYIIKDKQWIKNITAFIVPFILITIILLIPALMHIDIFKEKLSYQREYFERSSKNQSVQDKTNTYKAMTTWTMKDGTGYGIFITAIAGLIAGLIRRTKWALYAYSLIAAQYLFIGSYGKSFSRYSTFLIPFFVLFAFLALDIFNRAIGDKKWIKERIVKILSVSLIVLFLIPYLISFSSLLKETAKPHNLDQFLEWRKANDKMKNPILSFMKSPKLKGMGVIVLPDRYLVKPRWENLSKFISKRYKNILSSDLATIKYFEDWKIVKTFDEKTGKGGTFYILENSVPLEKLKKDTQLIKDKVPKHWVQF